MIHVCDADRRETETETHHAVAEQAVVARRRQPHVAIVAKRLNGRTHARTNEPISDTRRQKTIKRTCGNGYSKSSGNGRLFWFGSTFRHRKLREQCLGSQSDIRASVGAQATDEADDGCGVKSHNARR
jgi:hypothetical protein